MKEVFDLYDFWDGRDGLIDAEKVGDLLRCCGYNPTESFVQRVGGTKKSGMYYTWIVVFWFNNEKVKMYFIEYS